MSVEQQVFVSKTQVDGSGWVRSNLVDCQKVVTIVISIPNIGKKITVSICQARVSSWVIDVSWRVKVPVHLIYGWNAVIIVVRI